MADKGNINYTVDEINEALKWARREGIASSPINSENEIFNLNEFITPGSYRITIYEKTENGKTIYTNNINGGEGFPTGAAGILTITRITSNTILQEFKINNTGRVYHRRTSNGGADWESWYISTLESDLDDYLTLKAGIEIPNNDDLNDYRTVGKYYKNGIDTPEEKPANMPMDTIAFTLYVYVNIYTHQKFVNYNGKTYTRYWVTSSNADSHWTNWEYLYTKESELNTLYAKKTDIDNLKENTQIEMSNLGYQFAFGGYNTSQGEEGSFASARKRAIRLRTGPGVGGIWVDPGFSIKCVNRDYKFSVVEYDRYVGDTDYNISNVFPLGQDEYVADKKCYVKITIQLVNPKDENDQWISLWDYDDDGFKYFTDLGELAKKSIKIYKSNIKNEFQQINNKISNILYPTTNLPHTINAYNDLWDTLIEETSSIQNVKVKDNQGNLVYDEEGNVVYETVSTPVIKKMSIGKDTSNTYDIYLYRISANNSYINAEYGRVVPEYDENNIWNEGFRIRQKPCNCLISGVHGNEKATPLILYDFVRRMFKDSRYASLLNTYDWVIVPMVNPWGYDHTYYTNVINQSGTTIKETKNGYRNYNEQTDPNGDSPYACEQNGDGVNDLHHGIRTNSESQDINRLMGKDYTYLRKLFEKNNNLTSQEIESLLRAVEEEGNFAPINDIQYTKFNYWERWVINHYRANSATMERFAPLGNQPTDGVKDLKTELFTEEELTELYFDTDQDGEIKKFYIFKPLPEEYTYLDCSTTEAQVVAQALEDNRPVSYDGTHTKEKYNFFIDLHQHSLGKYTDEIPESTNANTVAFLTLSHNSSWEDRSYIYSQWLQAGAQTQTLATEEFDTEGYVQTILPWYSLDNTATFRNYMGKYAKYSMCFEDSMAATPYSKSTKKFNNIAIAVGSTQFCNFMQRLARSEENSN